MSELYERIELLCRENGQSITAMCKAAGASRASLSDLKMGRKQNLSADTLSKIAGHFHVSVDHLLGNAPLSVQGGKRAVSNEELKFALWGDCVEVSDEDLADVLRYAAFVRERKMDRK